MKNPENLDDKKNERERLSKALDLNAPLATAYYMKELLRQLWNLENKRAARRHLNDWIALAQASEIRMLENVAKTLTLHRKGILNYYDFPISTGP